MAQSRTLGHLPAHRVAEQVRRVPAEGIQDRDRVIGHVFGGISRRVPAHYRGKRAGRPRVREMRGLPGVTLIVGGDVKATVRELGDQGVWPPEP